MNTNDSVSNARQNDGAVEQQISSPKHAALQIAQQQVDYWRDELKTAIHAADTSRIDQCDRFMKQCEFVLGALKERST